MDNFTPLDALIGGDDDAQAVDRALHVLGKVEVLADRLEQERLLPVAKLLMARFVSHVDPLVLVDEVVGLVDLARMAE